MTGLANIYNLTYHSVRSPLSLGKSLSSQILNNSEMSSVNSKLSSQNTNPASRPNTGYGSKTVYPIKDISQIHALHTYFLKAAIAAPSVSKKRNAYRNWLYFALGINLGFRGGDISELTWGQLITLTPSGYILRANEEYNRINAEKTGKSHMIVLNGEAQQVIRFYIQHTVSLGVCFTPDSPVFPSNKVKGTSEAKVAGHVDCDNMGRILKAAAKTCGIPQNICTHSIRKTFGYHYFKATKDIVTLQKIFGHSSPAITLAYIGIDAEEIADAYNRKPDTCIDLEAFMDASEAEGELSGEFDASTVYHYPSKNEINVEASKTHFKTPQKITPITYPDDGYNHLKMRVCAN